MRHHMNMGLAVITGGFNTGAEDEFVTLRKRIITLDDQIHAFDESSYKQWIEWYGPGGLAAQKPLNTNTVYQEQIYANGWGKFVADWDAWKKKTITQVDDAAKTSNLADWADDSSLAEIAKVKKLVTTDLDKKSIAFGSWQKKYQEVKSAHNLGTSSEALVESLARGPEEDAADGATASSITATVGTVLKVGIGIAAVGTAWWFAKRYIMPHVGAKAWYVWEYNYEEGHPDRRVKGYQGPFYDKAKAESAAKKDSHFFPVVQDGPPP